MPRIMLSTDELVCLREALSDDSALQEITQRASSGENNRQILEIDPACAERMADCLTVQLAKVGFTEDYSLTQRGRMLEQLIDRLHGEG